jgi:hypothetical protein
MFTDLVQGAFSTDDEAGLAPALGSPCFVEPA